MSRKTILLVTLLIPFISLAQEAYDLASTAYNNQNYSQAIKHINKAIDDDKTAENFLLRGMINEQLENNSNAHDDYVQAITIDREYFEAYFQFSEFLFSTHEYERAIASLNFLLKRIEGGDTKGIFIKSDAHGYQGTQITSLVGMKPDILDKRARSLQKLGRLEEAMLDFDLALEEKEESPDILTNRGLLHAEMGSRTAAITDLTEAINLNPNSAVSWFNLLVIDPSIEIPESMSEMKDFAPMLTMKGVEAFESGDLAKAETLFNQALKLTPNDVLVLLNSGRVDQRNMDYTNAQLKFSRVLELDGDRSEVFYLLGNAYFGQKNYKNALNYYQQYLKRDPTHAQTWFNSAMAYLQLDESEMHANAW